MMPIWKVEFSLQLNVADTSRIRPTSLYISFPKTIAHRQSLTKLRFSYAAREVTDDIGNSWLLVEVPRTQRRFLFRYEAIVKTRKYMYIPQALEGVCPPPPTRFLRAERGIESDSQEVLELARSLHPGAPPLEIVTEAIALVHKTLRYRLQKGEYGAKFAIQNNEGDCTEYACLLAALLRASGIGARITVGYLGDELHAIAEVYLRGLWIPIDVTNIDRPIFGEHRDFIALLRGNWVSPGGSEQLLSFYYRSAGDIHPQIHSHTRVSPYRRAKVVVLSESKVKNSFRYDLNPNQVASGIKLELHKKTYGWDATVENLRSTSFSGRLLLLCADYVWKIWQLQIDSQDRQTIPQVFAGKSEGQVEFVVIDNCECKVASQTIAQQA